MASKQMATFRSAKVARVITSFDTARAARATRARPNFESVSFGCRLGL